MKGRCAGRMVNESLATGRGAGNLLERRSSSAAVRLAFREAGRQIRQPNVRRLRPLSPVSEQVRRVDGVAL